LKYDWNADSALPAGRQYQWTLDSLRTEHERQAALVQAAQAAQAESLRAQEEIAGARRAAPWVACILTRWKSGALGSNSPELPPTQLYTPCARLLPASADFDAYQARHHVRGDTAQLLLSSFNWSGLDRRQGNP
jgi:hypothetical protein